MGVTAGAARTKDVINVNYPIYGAVEKYCKVHPNKDFNNTFIVYKNLCLIRDYYEECGCDPAKVNWENIEETLRITHNMLKYDADVDIYGEAEIEELESYASQIRVWYMAYNSTKDDAELHFITDRITDIDDVFDDTLNTIINDVRLTD